MQPPRQIHRLDETTANRIAAGEVVERPAAVVKELVENAIDAQATQIRVRYQDSGKTLIEVHDNGFGIHPNELPLAIERHATSKIENNALDAIRSFGFRGEALPSIGAVSRLEINSRRFGQEARMIRVEGGKIEAPTPAPRNEGTTVRVRDLFYATPARLKFQGSDRAEALAILDVLKRLAMARPDIGFELIETNAEKTRNVLSLPRLGVDEFEARLRAVLGKALIDDSVFLAATREGVTLRGFLGLPTAARGAANAQYFFVNQRPVRDKLFFGAVKGAYSDLLPAGKFPFIVLFMEIDPKAIDVNVHPAKTEIRFRGAADIRSFVLNAVRHRLAENGLRSNQALTSQFAGGFGAGRSSATPYYQERPTQAAHQAALEAQFPGFREERRAFEPMAQPALAQEEGRTDLPLGLPRAHIFQNYIIAEAEDGLVIVDGHAAHERLVYEKLKTQYAEKRLAAQPLLIPEIINLSASAREALLTEAENLKEIGLEIEAFGVDAIAVQTVPALLSQAAIKPMIDAILDALDEDGGAAIARRIDHLLLTMACHGSVRSGRKLRPEEMDALLREMEATPNSGTCNHGRPTFIKLDLKTLESRFGR